MLADGAVIRVHNDVTTGAIPQITILTKYNYDISHNERFDSADVVEKHQIIGSIFPKKLQFENEAYRTTKINKAVLAMYKLGKATKKKRDKPAMLLVCPKR